MVEMKKANQEVKYSIEKCHQKEKIVKELEEKIKNKEK